MTICKVEIFHTNDLHSHLQQWPKIVSLIKAKRNFYKDQGHSVLLFDIGDHCDRVHPITEATLGKANVFLMNELGYDSATIGNNEGITISKEALSTLYEKATFPVLVGNLFDEDGKKPKWTIPYKTFSINDDLTIGVIGMTIPFKPFYNSLGWKIEDPFELLPSLVAQVREKANVIILLSHMGLNFDQQVAEQIDGIDIILGGHTHHVLKKGLHVKNTVIHQAGKFGSYVGHLSFSYHQIKKQMVTYEANCIPINDEIEPCQTTMNQLTRLQKSQQEILGERVVTLGESLEIFWDKPSQLAELMATALRNWCKAEIGMVNSGVILDRLVSGHVTRGDLHRICPHPINPCKIEINGKLLKEIILHSLSKEMAEKQIRGFGFRGKVMGLMVFDGVTYEEQIGKDGLVHIKNIKINEEPIKHSRIYQVATVDMFTFGHLYPTIAALKNKKYYMPELLRDLLAWQLRQLHS